MHRVLFVCMGNICRSPSAEAVFRHLVAQRGLTDQFVIASAGTDNYHVNGPADDRARLAAHQRGYDISQHCARQIKPDDWPHFDWLIAMDSRNWRRMQALWPEAPADRLTRLLTFCPEAPTLDVPDPYYGGPDGFEMVLDLLECGCEGLLNTMLKDS